MSHLTSTDDLRLSLIRLALRLLDGRGDSADRAVLVDMARDLGCPIARRLDRIGCGGSVRSRSARQVLRSLLLFAADETRWWRTYEASQPRKAVRV